MNAFQLTEEAKRQLHALLDKKYRPRTLTGLGTAVRDAIRDVWEEILPRFICIRGTELFGATRCNADDLIVEIDGIRYRLCVNTALGMMASIVQPHAIGIATPAQLPSPGGSPDTTVPAIAQPQHSVKSVAAVLFPSATPQLEAVGAGRAALLLLEPIGLLPEPGSMRSESITIRPLGGYSRLVLCLPDCIRLTDDQLDATKSVTASLIDVAYRWTESLIVEAIKDSTKRLSLGLYSYVRNMLGEELSRGIVFSCLTGGEDFVILDDIAAAGIFELAAVAGGTFALSPIATAAKLLGEVVSVRDSVIKDAAEKSETFELPLTGKDATQYYRNDAALYDSLRAVWGTGFTCTRILKNDKFTIVAFAPAADRNEIVPRLELYRDDLRDRATGQLKNVRNHLKLVRELGLATILEGGSSTPSPEIGRTLISTTKSVAGKFVRTLGAEEVSRGIGTGLAALVKGLLGP